MKVAVLTYNFNNNYGGMLQAYAMLTILKNLNHQPELLLVPTINLSKKSGAKRLLKKYIFCYIPTIFPNDRILEKISKNTNYFIEKYITPKTTPIYKKNHFSNITKNNYDAYLVGSDQVWRAKVYRYIDYAFFGFVKSDAPIFLSYAASFGVETWEYTREQTEKYSKQIQRFSGVAVREESGVALCKKYFNKEAIHVLDPTMLLNVHDYIELANTENEPNHNGELLTYILDINADKQNIIDMVTKELDFKSFRVNLKAKTEITSIEDMTYPTVTSWLRGFENAKYVITDSFHGCVFAILFNKPFIVYGNKERGMARFDSLLKMFQLEERLILNKNDLTIEKIKEKIDWENVNYKLEEYRTISKKYLHKALKSE